MILSLMGMAGTGKSYWSSKLAEKGYTRWSCDEEIAEKLGIPSGPGRDLIADMGKWMGLPFDPGYREREARYLAREREVLREMLESLRAREKGLPDDVVVDTAGSVIYTGPDLLEALREETVVVHLRTSPDARRALLEAYLSRPAPVLWRGLFNPRPRETLFEALARCYPGLLAERESLYARYAHVGIDYHRHRHKGYGIEELLQDVRRGPEQGPGIRSLRSSTGPLP